MSLYLAFIVISLAVLLVPGPSILLIVANSLQRGRIIGLYTVAGGFVAMCIQLLVALLGLTSLVTVLDTGFDFIRWCGAAYLMYLGVLRWRGVTHSDVRGRATEGYGSALVEGFVVALTNPGTMLFFVAFFPQFLLDTQPVTPQLITLALTFMALTAIVDTSYALLSARIGHVLHEPQRRQARNRLAGGILMVAAVVLALVNI